MSSPRSAAPPPRPHDASIESLVETELGMPHESIPRAGQNRIVAPPEDLFGISLSGGGIRSATFNLGLLQGLHDMGLLGAFKYLSTVSGGGYVGSFWTAWRSRPANQDSVFPERGPGAVEPRPIRHLREFSGFLAPRLGVFSWDTGRMLVAATGSMLPSLLAAFSVLSLVFLVWLLGADFIFDPDARVSTGVLTGATAFLLVAGEVLYLRRKERTSPGAYLVGCLLALAVTAGTWLLVHPVVQAMPMEEGDLRAVWLYKVSPAAVFLAGTVVFTLRRWFGSRFEHSEYRQLRRGAFERVHSRLLFAAGAWTVVATLWFLGEVVHAMVDADGYRGTALGGATAATVAAFTYARKKLADPALEGVRGKVMAVLAPAIPRILAYVAVGLMAVCTVAVLIALEGVLPAPELGPDEALPWWAQWTPLGVPAGVNLAILAAVLGFMDPNQMGLHAFYKGRIARAYMGASNDGGGDAYYRLTEEQPGDDLRFAGRRTPTGHRAPSNEPHIHDGAPVHLVCCAANDLTSDPVATLNRGAVSATLSRAGFSVGDDWAPWHAQLGAPTLAHAATASGAAFNSLMGAYSVQFGPAVTFLMSALNLRLGLWLPHPRARVHGRRGKLLKRALVGLPFLKEMLGLARANGQDVHLSDGGHFENLGLYELIRRHCRYIVAADCGADPKVLFNDFGNLVRRVREDFGVDVRIDLSPLRPDPQTGLARQPMVAGDIHYPEGDTGILLLFKPTLTGSEPADVAQYRSRNPVFPHESTGDQFFDEAQWESYRRLGQHAAHSAFRAVGSVLRRDQKDYAAQLLARARREWQPKPSGFDERLARFTDRVAGLDALLRQEGCGTLLIQVYKELDELDRQTKVRVGRIVGEKGVKTPPENEQPADGAPRGVVPSGAELAMSLHAIRLALLMMDEVFQAEQLDRRYHHPLYLGVMNYFARWAYAPLFRMWWPLLKALHPQPFTRFMEAQFGLAAVGVGGDDGEKVVARLSEGAGGFAWECWRRQGNEWPAGREVVSYNLKMRYPGYSPPYDIQAAQVVADEVKAPDQGWAALAWDAADFFVPPGLWGIGIGEDFLRRVGAARYAGADRLYVRVRIPRDGGASARKAAADEMQLYRSADFREVPDGAVPAAVREALLASRPCAQEDCEVRWLIHVAMPAVQDSETTATAGAAAD